MQLEELTLAAFAACNGVRILAYIPQIAKAATDRNGAAAISCTTWLLFLVAHLSTVAYAIVNQANWGLAACFAGNGLLRRDPRCYSLEAPRCRCCEDGVSRRRVHRWRAECFCRRSACARRFHDGAISSPDCALRSVRLAVVSDRRPRRTKRPVLLGGRKSLIEPYIMPRLRIGKIVRRAFAIFSTSAEFRLPTTIACGRPSPFIGHFGEP